MDNEIKRFIEFVKKESDEDEDFVLDRVKKSALYKKLETQYDNMDEVCEFALRKSSWYQRMKDLMTAERKQYVNSYSNNESPEEQAKRLIFRTSMYCHLDKENHRVYEKFMWRYGSEEAMKIAREVVAEYPADGTLYGKFRGRK